MTRFLQLSLWLSYPIIIGISVLWSGTTVEKTLYDRYIIYNEGLILHAKDAAASRKFYADILDFPAFLSTKGFTSLGDFGFALGEQQSVYLRDKDVADTTPIVLVRVRNGFFKLHGELLKRLGSAAQIVVPETALSEISPGKVSEVYRGPLGDQFVVRDPSGNRVLFYQKRLRLF